MHIDSCEHESESKKDNGMTKIDLIRLVTMLFGLNSLEAKHVVFFWWQQYCKMADTRLPSTIGPEEITALYVIAGRVAKCEWRVVVKETTYLGVVYALCREEIVPFKDYANPLNK